MCRKPLSLLIENLENYTKGRIATMATTHRQNDIVTPADWVPGPKQGHWTYDDYAALPDDGKRYEIVDGVLYMTPPSPNGFHQGATNLFSTYLTIHIQFTGLGRVYAGPLDVELATGTVVQPDVLVLLNSNLHKITFSRIIGAPDLAIEVSSPGTVKQDKNTKLKAYALAGVSEYWIADPKAHTVEVLLLEDGAYRSAGVFSGEQTLPSRVVPNFPIQVEQFFA